MCFTRDDVRSARHQFTLPAHRYRYRVGASFGTTFGTQCTYAQKDGQAELS